MSNVNAAISNKHLRDGMIKSKSTKMVDWVIAVVCFVFMLLCLLPIVHVLACSLSSPEALIRNEVFLWPKGWNIEAYKTVLTTEKYVRSLGFTAILTIGCTLVSLALTICCAYPLIYPNLRGAKLINFLILFTMYFSAGTIPMYVLLNNLNMLDSPWVLVIPNCISVVIISTALQIPNAIFTESFLSFVGLGVNAPMPSLGSLAADALNGISSYPSQAVSCTITP